MASRAVVTPAARDWLRARAIELIRDGRSTTPNATTALGKLYIHATLGPLRRGGWNQVAQDAGWELEPLVPCAVEQATAELAAVDA